MVEADCLAKIFVDEKRRRVDAVRSVSFRCEPGEIFGLLGVNGAGKTTLLRMLATILRPSGGSARVAGWDVRTDSEQVRRHIGYMSASTALYERLSPREILRYFAALYGLGPAAAEARIDALFEQLDITPFQARRCDRLSTGQKQRVSIARTIVHDPGVLFFDEPTNGLDVLASRTITTFIRSCRAAGSTVIFSTHIMSEVEALCDRIAIIHDGAIAAIGTLAELKAQTGEQSLEQVFLALVNRGEER